MMRSDAVEVRVDGPFAGGVVVWQRHPGEFVATVVAKATYALEPELCALLDEPDPIQIADDHWDDDPQRSVRIPSDLALFKVTNDVVVIGNAYAAKAAQSAVARIVIGSVDKCVDARVPSRFTRDGQLDASTPVVRLPLRYEVAPLAADNPVGIDPTVFDEAAQRYRLPQLFPPSFLAQPGAAIPFTGIGPIAPAWPMRASLLRHEDVEWLTAPTERPMPHGFDARYFSIAPVDQRAVDAFHADERLLLECLHPQHPRLVANLAGVRPALYRARGAELAKLVADTLLVDTDRGIVTLTFRAVVPVDLHTKTKLELRVQGSEPQQTPPPAPRASRAGESTVQLDRLVDPLTSEAAMDTTSVEMDGGAAAVLPFINAALNGGDRQRAGASADAGLPFGRKTSPEMRVEPAKTAHEATAPVPTAKGSAIPPPPSSMRQSVPPPASVPTSSGSVSPPPPAVVPAPPASISGLRPPTQIPPAPVPPAPVAPLPKPSSVGGIPQPRPSTSGLPSSPPIAPLSALAPAAAPPPLAPLSAIASASGPPLAPLSALSPAPLGPSPLASPMSGASRGPTVGGPTIGERQAQAVVPAVVSDAMRVSATPPAKVESPGKDGAGPAKDPFSAAFAPAAAKPGSLGAKAASDAAADKESREVAKERLDAPRSNVERRYLVDLLAFEDDVPRRLRRSKAFTSLISDFAPPRAFRRIDEADKDGDKEERSRLEVLRVLSCGDPVDLGVLGNAIDAVIEDPNDLEIPLFLLSGELRPTFDEVEALRAAVRIAQPLSSTDKRLTASIAVANEVVAATTPPSADTAHALLKQIEGAVSGLNVPNRYLADAIERTLLENRHYKKRVVLGQSRIRCELSVHGTSPWPAYVPEALGPKLPMLTSFTVVALAEVRPREDAFESHAEALFFCALGRVVRKRR